VIPIHNGSNNWFTDKSKIKSLQVIACIVQNWYGFLIFPKLYHFPEKWLLNILKKKLFTKDKFILKASRLFLHVKPKESSSRAMAYSFADAMAIYGNRWDKWTWGKHTGWQVLHSKGNCSKTLLCCTTPVLLLWHQVLGSK
jgi:hypothetical protein